MDTFIFNQISFVFFSVVFLASLFGALIWWIVIKNKFKTKRKPRHITPLNIFTVGTFIAIYFLFMDFADFSSVIDSFKNTLNIFRWGISFNDIIASIAKCNPSEIEMISNVDKVFIASLFFGTPILTMRAFFSLFKDKFTGLRYYIALFWDCHVFSELTEKSICLATDIYNESESFFKPLIIFCNVNAGNISDGLLLKAENINAGFYKKSILDFKINKIFRGELLQKAKAFGFSKENSEDKKRVDCIYLTNANDMVNERDCVYLTQTNNETTDHLYIFSSLESTVCIVNASKKSVNYSVHLINEAQMIAYSLLFEHPMFESAYNGKNSVVVVGAGNTGLEIAKNSMWCGMMNSLGFKLRIIDKDDKMKELKAKYGDFKKEAKDAGVELDCDCLQLNIDLDGLDDAVQDNEDATYIVVALGNDELTLSTAILLRKLYRRTAVLKNSDYLPRIIPILKSNNYKEIADSVREFDLTPFGFFENIYSCSMVNHWNIEKIARNLNKKYNEAADYKNPQDYDELKEFERLSNRAVAVHSKYKVYDAGFCIVKAENGKYELSERKTEQSFSEEERRKNEHNRWALFMILNGWKTMPESVATARKNAGEKYPQKDYITETHACIVSNEVLEDVGRKIKGNSKAYIDFDLVVVKNTPEFLIAALNAEINSKEKKL